MSMFALISRKTKYERTHPVPVKILPILKHSGHGYYISKTDENAIPIMTRSTFIF